MGGIPIGMLATSAGLGAKQGWVRGQQGARLVAAISNRATTAQVVPLATVDNSVLDFYVAHSLKDMTRNQGLYSLYAALTSGVKGPFVLQVRESQHPAPCLSPFLACQPAPSTILRKQACPGANLALGCLVADITVGCCCSPPLSLLCTGGTRDFISWPLARRHGACQDVCLWRRARSKPEEAAARVLDAVCDP
jgi:hypothetical protein